MEENAALDLQLFEATDTNCLTSGTSIDFLPPISCLVLIPLDAPVLKSKTQVISDNSFSSIPIPPPCPSQCPLNLQILNVQPPNSSSSPVEPLRMEKPNPPLQQNPSEHSLPSDRPSPLVVCPNPLVNPSGEPYPAPAKKILY